MHPIPTTPTKQNRQSLEEEIVRLRAQLHIEKDARIEAETELLMFDIAQENGDPPPSRMAIIAGLAHLAKSRDDDTGEHLSRIQQYTTIIATAFAKLHPEILPLGEVSIIGAASVLHDIGKVGIADDVLLHQGKFSTQQFESMKHHSTIGADILIALSDQLGRDPWIDTAIQIALGHHERWDGTGYPFGLKGNTINLPARIVAVADVYDALRTKRVYKEAFSHADTIEIIKKESGSHFDPWVVEALLSNVDNLMELSQRQINASA